MLRDGDLLGIYPEGTRSPDGRLYKGKTGVARLVLQAGVPVIPVAMIDTADRAVGRSQDSHHAASWIRIGQPLDFTAYAGAGNDREVLRWVTDEIMDAVMTCPGQVYVDAYGGSVKSGPRRKASPRRRQVGAARRRPAGAARARGTIVTGEKSR